jgi:hypothetical protein
VKTYDAWVRDRSDEDLRAMLAERPELITPVPADLTALATRAATPSAVVRCLDRLDRLALAAVEALLVLTQPVPYDRLASMLEGAGDRQVKGVVERLLTLGLVWTSDGELRTAPGVRQALPYPAGLGPPARDAFAGYAADRLETLAADLGTATPSAFPDAGAVVDAIGAFLSAPADLIDDAGPEAGAALEQLTWGPPVGRVEGARRPVRIATAATPIERLLARGLLAATGESTVTLPREVGLHLRQGRLFREPLGAPPELDGAVRDPALVDRTAGGQAFTFVRTVEDLLERWGVDPPQVLRSGGLSVRDLRATATALDVPEWTAALLVEVAYAAGLLARYGGEWLPTRAYDMWRLRDAAVRWSESARAWLDTDRVPGLAGARDERGKTINALAEESVRTSAAPVRRATLNALAATSAAPDAEAVRAYLAWREPRRGGQLRNSLIEWTLREVEVLGLTGRGAIASHARALLTHENATARLTAVLPEPVDHVLIQADLTAIAPGPLVAKLGRELALMADVESTGGATVYRFSPVSVRRALDAGRSAAELLDTLHRHSRTPVPQPLAYLIDDVARKHGHLRVGIASCYVRCDDPATLDEIFAAREAPSLRLHRLAPTVLATRLSRSEILEALRAMGFAPVAESSEGGVVITRPDARRAESSPTSHPVQTRAVPDESMVAAAVRALRSGDEAARHSAEFTRLRLDSSGAEPPRTPSMATVEELRAAVERGGRVWIGYLDQQGQASSRIVEPVRVDGGFLTAYDATRASVQRFALHRITGVAGVGSAESSESP